MAIVGVGGFASNVGKTGLMCQLIAQLPGWEAIKTTRGHYRSCGKDPHTCCVSDLLSDQPIILSGRVETYQPGKDTGRFWDAGAANVHWLIATDEQVEKGIKEVLTRVKSRGVLIEGNSFSEYVYTDLMIMVRRGTDRTIKRTARRALAKCSAIYLSDGEESGSEESSRLMEDAQTDRVRAKLAVLTPDKLPALIDTIRRLTAYEVPSF